MHDKLINKNKHKIKKNKKNLSQSKKKRLKFENNFFLNLIIYNVFFFKNLVFFFHCNNILKHFFILINLLYNINFLRIFILLI